MRKLYCFPPLFCPSFSFLLSVHRPPPPPPAGRSVSELDRNREALAPADRETPHLWAGKMFFRENKSYSNAYFAFMISFFQNYLMAWEGSNNFIWKIFIWTWNHACNCHFISSILGPMNNWNRKALQVADLLHFFEFLISRWILGGCWLTKQGASNVFLMKLTQFRGFLTASLYFLRFSVNI